MEAYSCTGVTPSPRDRPQIAHAFCGADSNTTPHPSARTVQREYIDAAWTVPRSLCGLKTLGLYEHKKAYLAPSHNHMRFSSVCY